MSDLIAVGPVIRPGLAVVFPARCTCSCGCHYGLGEYPTWDEARAAEDRIGACEDCAHCQCDGCPGCDDDGEPPMTDQTTARDGACYWCRQETCVCKCPCGVLVSECQRPEEDD